MLTKNTESVNNKGNRNWKIHRPDVFLTAEQTVSKHWRRSITTQSYPSKLQFNRIYLFQMPIQPTCFFAAWASAVSDFLLLCMVCTSMWSTLVIHNNTQNCLVIWCKLNSYRLFSCAPLSGVLVPQPPIMPRRA